MRIGFSCGYFENYWGTDWHNSTMLGGSERILIEVACALAEEHDVTVRLPYGSDGFQHRGVRWVGRDHPVLDLDLAFLFDQYGERDRAAVSALVACRSDPPAHKDFDVRIYLSRHHARLMGDAGAPAVGGGVALGDYQERLPRIPRRVLCSASPDRVPAAARIGRAFDFVHTYKPVPGFSTIEVTREELIRHQKQAQVFIFPYDPARESDFFSMAVLEALASGTPVVMADGESHMEWWGDAAMVLPRPIDIGGWYEAIEGLMSDPALWLRYSRLGREKAKAFDWRSVAQRYLDCAWRNDGPGSN